MTNPVSDDELAAGRGEVDSTSSPDWLILSGCSARGLQLYSLLRLRLNRRRRTRKVWPGLATLAVMMKLTTSESVSPYVKELERLGAIDVRRIGQTKHNTYLINFTPPPGYTGPMCIEDWDDDPVNKRAAQAIRDAEKVKREKTRAKAAKPQVRRDPGKTRDQPGRVKTASPDPGISRDPDPGKKTDHDPGSFGVESLGVTEVLEVTVSSTSALSRVGGLEAAPLSIRGQEPKEEKDILLSESLENQETEPVEETKENVLKPRVLPTLTEWEHALAQECLPLSGSGARRWDYLAVRKVLGSRKVRAVTAENPDLVRRAFRRCATENRATVSLPIRLWYVAECPIWRDAEAELAADRVRPEPKTEPEPNRTVPAQTTLAPRGRAMDNPELAAFKATLAARNGRKTEVTAGQPAT